MGGGFAVRRKNLSLALPPEEGFFFFFPASHESTISKSTKKSQAFMIPNVKWTKIEFKDTNFGTDNLHAVVNPSGNSTPHNARF